MRPIEFGSDKTRMKQVPEGTEAVFSFNGNPELVETDYGEKYSFPITLISHPSYPLLEDGPIDMVWESKSACAKELFDELGKSHQLDKDGKWIKMVEKAYKENKWQLTRFDSGVYHLVVLQ
jgi:hypothetical protein